MNRKILVTGALGVIAGKVIPELAKQYDLTLLDLRNTDRSGKRIEGIVTADLLAADRDAYRTYFRGVHAVIHSGFVHPKDPEDQDARFQAELENVRMAYNVYQACVEEGVRRLVNISSNHAADFYEQHILDGRLTGIGPETPAYSDNFYGWAKVSYEALGFAFAAGKLNGGRRLSNVQLRIGAPRETDIEACRPGDLRKMKRDLGAYLSLRDEVQLIVKSIETENIDNEWGVPFQIFYGVSGNTFGFWKTDNARRIIGYEPEDDGAVRFAEHMRRIADGSTPTRSV